MGQTQKPKDMVNRGDLSVIWNLRLNKAKSKVLTEDPQTDIAGVPCLTQVKYLGVPISLDPKLQRD